MGTPTQSQRSLPSSFEAEFIAEKGEYRHCRHGLRKPSWLSVPSSLWSELSKIPELGPDNIYICIIEGNRSAKYKVLRSSRNGCIGRGEIGREPAFHENNN